MELKFVPDVGRFIAEYPSTRPVNLVAQQYFCQLIDSQEKEIAVFRALAKWNQCDQWRQGFVQTPANWLKNGDYLINPPLPAGRRLPTVPAVQDLTWEQLTPEMQRRVLADLEVMEKKLREFDEPANQGSLFAGEPKREEYPD